MVEIIGAGLAGCEATYQLIKRGIKVRLWEMRPVVNTPVHTSDSFAELVCSNSLRSNDIYNAVGLLKAEMLELDSLIIKTALQHQLPAGSALAVDRVGFSKAITDYLRNHELVEVVNQEAVEIPSGEVIIASGPLTSDSLAKAILKIIDQDYLSFYDAVAPIVTLESIDTSIAYFKSRYDKGEASYLNCPMTKQEFTNFYQELIKAQVVAPKEIDKVTYFEGCMPFEEMARRGEKTLLFGPMKPVGLEHNGNRPYAVVQLRQDDAAASLYNIVGFQTHLTWGEQKRILQMIPGLANCEIVRYGVMHRNTFINSPKCLNNNFQLKTNDNIFFAGQLTGVEGYVESASSGLLAGLNMALKLNNKPLLDLDNKTMIGSLASYISNKNITNFQPMNANYGIMRLEADVKKSEKKVALYNQSMQIIKEIKQLI